MNTKNVLSTNYGSFLNYREVLHYAKDAVLHYGLGEKLRFDLNVYVDPKNRQTVAVYSDLPYKDPWLKNTKTLLNILSNIRKTLAKTFGVESLSDVDLAASAEAWLQKIGMTGEEISALKAKLGADIE